MKWVLSVEHELFNRLRQILGEPVQCQHDGVAALNMENVIVRANGCANCGGHAIWRIAREDYPEQWAVYCGDCIGAIRNALLAGLVNFRVDHL